MIHTVPTSIMSFFTTDAYQHSDAFLFVILRSVFRYSFQACLVTSGFFHLMYTDFAIGSCVHIFFCGPAGPFVWFFHGWPD